MSPLSSSSARSSRAANNPKIAKVLAQKKGIILDISFGGTPQPRSVTMGPQGDIKHDPTEIPFPLPDGCVNTGIITHILEYIPQPRFFAWWDELWRVTQPYGVVYINGPYGGDESMGWLSDPQHITRIVEQSFAWLDPTTPMYALHPSLGRRTPKPWVAKATARVPGTYGTISYNVTLQKVEVQAPALAKGAPRARR